MATRRAMSVRYGVNKSDTEQESVDNNGYIQASVSAAMKQRGNYNPYLAWSGMKNLKISGAELGTAIATGVAVFTCMVYFLQDSLVNLLHGLCGLFAPMFSVTCAFYWLALYLRKSWNGTSVYLFFLACYAGEIIGQVCFGGDNIFRSWVVASVLISASFASLTSTLPTSQSALVITFLSFMRFLSGSTLQALSGWIRPFLAYFCGIFGCILAKYTETHLFRQHSAAMSFAPDGKIPVIRRRRTSSQSSASSHHRSRRTSLPALIQKNQVCNSVVDVAVMQEAHGLIMDMLADPAIPSNVISGLKTVSSLLSPPSSFNTMQRPNISPLVALTESHTADMEDSPYGGGERPLSLPKRLRRSLPPSLIRRMSTTWTTTTSATGMPTLEPQPLRTRSSSFRHNRDNSTSPSGSRCSSPSPTSSQQMVVNSGGKGRSFSVGTGGLSPRSRERSPSPSPLLLPDNKQRSSSLSPRQLASGRLHLDENRSQSPSGFDGDFIEEDTQQVPMGPVTLSVSPSSPTEIKPKTAAVSNSDLPNGDSTDGDNQIKDNVTNKVETEERTEKGPKKRNSVTISDKATVIEDSGTRIVPTEGEIDEEQEVPSKPELLNGEAEEDWDPTLPECAELLNRLDEWDFPIFDLDAAAGDQVLSQLAYRVFMDAGIFETFRLPVREFINYFRALENGYWHKPYHNRLHAADVLHAVYYFSTQQIPGFTQVNPEDLDPMRRTDNDDPDSSYHTPTVTPRASISCDSSYGILAGNLPALELMALMTAAAMHDYDHPGRTNAFLVATGAPQALLYNDRSVLENHHAASSWRLFVSKPEFNFLSSLDSAELRRFRFLVIEFILATDLKRHFDFLVEFNAKVNDVDASGINWSSDADRLLVGQMCIKLADISGPTKVCPLHKKWTYRITEEFYEQGDDERRLGLPVSPYMDRNAPQLAKLQEGFINHLVAPLCNAYGSAGLLPGRWLDEVEDGEEMGEKSESGKSDDDGRKSESDDKDDELEEEDTSSDESKLRPKRSSISKSRKMVSILTKHIKDNHEMWIKVLKEEEEAAQREKEVVKEKAESPEKMTMPLIREDSEERNSDDRAAVEEIQLKVIEEKNAALSHSSPSSSSPSSFSSPSSSSPSSTEQKIEAKAAMPTVDEDIEAAPHEPLQPEVLSETSGAPPEEDDPKEQDQLESDSMDTTEDT